MSHFFSIYSICVIPLLILLWYIYIKDKIESEPLYLLFVLFIGGIIASLICILSSETLKEIFDFLILDYDNLNIFQILFKVIISIALIEESSKWIINYLIVWRNENFNHVYDPIMYCAFVSGGFAGLENLLYGFAYKGLNLFPIFMRGLISVPCHICFAVIMGYFLGKAKQNNSKKYKILSIIIPVLVHSIYDLLLINNSMAISIIFVTFVIILYIISYLIINKLCNIKELLKKA